MCIGQKPATTDAKHENLTTVSTPTQIIGYIILTSFDDFNFVPIQLQVQGPLHHSTIVYQDITTADGLTEE